jgi:glycerophosphoryl diester phosphodiesterase
MAYATTPSGRRIEIIGHRGSPRDIRENTLPSFARAFELGSDGVELDVHGTTDGFVVIHHDPVTNSRSGDTGPRTVIARSTFASLQTIAVGDAPMPTLEALLAVVPHHAVAYVEVKGKGIEESVVSVIRSSRTRCAVHSFDHRIAQRVHLMAPDIPVGILQTSYPIDPLRPMRDAGARDLWQHWELIDQALIDCVHDDGRRVIAWTVNDTDAARRLVSWDIDGICSDVPGDMRVVVDELVR